MSATCRPIGYRGLHNMAELELKVFFLPVTGFICRSVKDERNAINEKGTCIVTF